MNICIYGAGAIGTIFAVRLAQCGANISVIARNDSFQAIAEKGVGLAQPDSPPIYADVTVATSLADLPEQDMIIIAVKQPAIAEIAGLIAPHISANTQIMLAMNGVPWWFLDNLAGAPDDRILRTLDPDGNLRQLLPTSQIIGAVIHMSSFMVEAGLACLRAGNKIILGRADRKIGQPLEACASLCQQAGFEVETSAFIQKDIWFKLWGNMTMNPISALTRTTTDRILDDKLVHQFVCDIMTEAQDIGAQLGIEIDTTPQERNRVTRKLGAMRTSMLQDVEAGRILEVDALLGGVSEIADKLGYQAHHISILYGLTRLLAESQQPH